MKEIGPDNNNTLSVFKQIDNSCISRKLLYDVCCGLENLEFLHKLISESLEDYGSPKNIELRPEYLAHDIKRIIQISYIIDNELERAKEAIQTLIDEVERPNKFDSVNKEQSKIKGN